MMYKTFLIFLIVLCIFGVSTSFAADPLQTLPEVKDLITKPPGVSTSALPDNPGYTTTVPEYRNSSSSSHIGGSLVQQGNIPHMRTNMNISNMNSANQSPILNQSVPKLAQVSYVPDQVIVKYRTDLLVSSAEQEQTRNTINSAIGASLLSDLGTIGIEGMQVVSIPNSTGVEEAVKYYQNNSMVQFAQPNYIYSIEIPAVNSYGSLNQVADTNRKNVVQNNQTISLNSSQSTTQISNLSSQLEPIDLNSSSKGVSDNYSDTSNMNNYNVHVETTTPNDPSFSLLWGLHNTGQAPFYGTVDADIDAPAAWDITTGSSSVIVAVVDTGVDYTHADLYANILRNSSGVIGYDFVNGDADPMDDNSHGTHCAGTIAGVGNNGIGVTGVSWNSKIMPLKFLNSAGSGTDVNALQAFAWGYARGARIFSCSWGGYYTDSALDYAFNTLYPDALFICAAGNGDSSGNAVNIDATPFYPAGSSAANVISVTATNYYDIKDSWANYGATSVDLAAPGDTIYSTVPTSLYSAGYSYKSGTSMATPHVAGVAALVKGIAPSYTVAQIKSAILTGVDTKSGLSGKCVTGGRLNANQTVCSVVPLQAKFYGVPDTQIFPMTVHFYDASTGNPTSWAWSFGDGNTSTQQNPVHMYSSAGSFPVTLTVQRNP